MTLLASSETVLAITAPQPSLKALLMTLRFVPGGPEPMTKGLGSLRPSTVVASVGMISPFLLEVRGKCGERLARSVARLKFSQAGLCKCRSGSRTDGHKLFLCALCAANSFYS